MDGVLGEPREGWVSSGSGAARGGEGSGVLPSSQWSRMKAGPSTQENGADKAVEGFVCRWFEPHRNQDGRMRWAPRNECTISELLCVVTEKEEENTEVYAGLVRGQQGVPRRRA